MKYFVIFLLFLVVFSINDAFAQVKDCTFGGTMTPLSEKFAKDLAVKEFVSQNPSVTRSIVPDEHDSSRNLLVLHAEDNEINEILELQFDTDEKGCHIPVLYHYTYDNGIIAFTVTNTIGNFTEIMNLIKSDDITMDDLYPDNCKFLTLEHSMYNGTVYGICKEKNSVIALVDAYSKGAFEVTIPIKTLYSLPSTNCIPTGDFFVIDDSGESDYDISQSDRENHVKVELDEGFHRIRILGSIILPSPFPAQYCGIVEGYDKPYLPPLHQIKHEMSPTSVKCNGGLSLIQKYDGSPACVKPETKTKLIERNWAKDSKNPLQIIIPYGASNSTKLNFVLPDDHFKSGNFIEIINQDDVTHDITGEYMPHTESFSFHLQLESGESWKHQIISNYDIELTSKNPLTDKSYPWMSKIIHVAPRQESKLSPDSPPVEPDTGDIRYGLEVCSYNDENGNSQSCTIEGWSKRASELNCEEICKPPPTKGEK